MKYVKKVNNVFFLYLKNCIFINAYCIFDIRVGLTGPFVFFFYLNIQLTKVVLVVNNMILLDYTFSKELNSVASCSI